MKQRPVAGDQRVAQTILSARWFFTQRTLRRQDSSRENREMPRRSLRYLNAGSFHE